jgi:dipeptidyl aminopeptidase/acylaminoacyl peptidase
MGEGSATKRSKIWLAWLGLVILLAGGFLAHAVRTADNVTVRDIRFNSANGARMSALLYVPAAARAGAKVPGILAVHG